MTSATRAGLVLQVVLAATAAGVAGDALSLQRDGDLFVITNVPGRSEGSPQQRPRRFAAADLPPSPHDFEIALAASHAGLSPVLIKAVAFVESGLDARAVSPKGALGLMQLMPETARTLGVTDPFDPRQNLRAGARYLSQQLERFDGDLRLALAAYNAGPASVLRAGDVPNYPETQRYVSRVYARLDASAPSARPAVARPLAAGPAAPRERPADGAVRMLVRPDGSVVLQN